MNDETRLVHLLRHGAPLCGFSTDPPSEWPQRDWWIYAGDYEPAAAWHEAGVDGEFCAACVQALG